jgi:hypothetical protein
MIGGHAQTGAMIGGHAQTGAMIGAHAQTGAMIEVHALKGAMIEAHALIGAMIEVHALIGAMIEVHALKGAMIEVHALKGAMIEVHVLQDVVTELINVHSVMTVRHASVTAMGMNASPLPTNHLPYAGKAADRQDAAGGVVLRVADVLDRVLVVDAAWAVDAVARDSHRRLDLSGNETPTSTDLKHMLQTSTCSRRTLTKTNLRNARCEAAGRSLHPTVKLRNRYFCHKPHEYFQKAFYEDVYCCCCDGMHSCTFGKSNAKGHHRSA